MTIDRIRKLHSANPFHPFRIQLEDGRSFEVSHPESLAINAQRKFIAVADQGAFDIIRLSLITELKIMKTDVGD